MWEDIGNNESFLETTKNSTLIPYSLISHETCAKFQAEFAKECDYLLNDTEIQISEKVLVKNLSLLMMGMSTEIVQLQDANEEQYRLLPGVTSENYACKKFQCQMLNEIFQGQF